MVEVAVQAGNLILEVQGWHKLWSLKSRLEIPLAHVKTLYADPEPAMGWFQGLKLAGTDVPNVFRAGLFFQEGQRVFWDVRDPEKTVVIELHDEWYGKLIVEVEDPQATVQFVKDALGQTEDHTDAARAELEAFLKGGLV